MLERFRKGDKELFSQLAGAASRLARSAALLERLLVSGRDAEDALAQEIHALGHSAQDLVGSADAQTFREFIMRMDRMEMHGLATALDSAIEALDEATQLASAVHASEAPRHLQALARCVTRAAELLERAVPGAERSWEGIPPAVEEMHALSERGEQAFAAGVSALFSESPDAHEVLRWKDVYEKQLEALACASRVLDTLARVATNNR